MLKKVLTNVKEHFTYVGIQEYFDESMQLLFHKLNWKKVPYGKLNAAHRELRIDADLAAEIERTNKIDVELYEILKDQFLSEYHSNSKIKFENTFIKTKRWVRRIIKR